MRILILTNYFPPEIGAASHLMYDLAESFADDGHEVSVVTGFPRYRLGTRNLRRFLRKDQVGRSRVVRVMSSPFDRGGPIRRGLDHLYLAPSLSFGALVAGKPDVVLVYSPPLTLGLAAWALSKMWGVPYMVNVQDLFPQYAIDVGLMRNRLMIAAFEAIERFIYRTADGITANSPGSRLHILARGGDPDRVRVVSNWMDIDLLKPGPTDTDFRREYALDGQFVVQYAGTMGYQQDLDTVIEAAALLRDEPDLCFQLVGDGVARERLEARTAELQLDNVHFVHVQPRDRYPEVLQSADACLVTLHQSVKTPAIPSKLLASMAAGKPVVIAADGNGDAPKTVQGTECGICVPPGRPELLAQTLRTLRQKPDLAREMGRRGRCAAERHFSRQAAARQFEDLFDLVIRRRTA